MQSYLAMTPREIEHTAALPKHMGWMACHFDPNGQGLRDVPRTLPPGSVLLLDDSLPIGQHMPARIRQELEEAFRMLRFDALILDLQKPGLPETAALVRALSEGLPFPVVVSGAYAVPELPVLLPPVPADTALHTHLEPWKNHSVWLELSAAEQNLRLSSAETIQLPYTKVSSPIHQDQALHCHYQISQEANGTVFHFFRTREDLHALTQEAQQLGLAGTIGLYQELGQM